MGVPDGLSVDEEGCVWVAFWGGSAVLRFGPDGSAVGGVELPASQVTSCAFGDTDLQTLFITTAGGYLTDAQRAEESHSGAVFAVETGVRGVPFLKLRSDGTPCRRRPQPISVSAARRPPLLPT